MVVRNAASTAVRPRGAETLAARAARLHRRALVIDAQAVRTTDPPSLAGGITAMVITLAWRIRDDTAFALRQIATQLEFIDFYADRVILVRSADDIERGKRQGRLGIILNFEGSSPIGNDLSLVRVFRELGLRTMQLTYNERSLSGYGCLEPDDRGLTSFGRELVRSMERVGVLVDLTHAGRRTALDALARAHRPVVFSHCNPATLFEMPHNVPDQHIRACAATGGVVGITPNSAFYGPAHAPRPTVSDMVTHIAYVADLVGIDHVGISYEAPPGGSAFGLATRAERDRDEVAVRPYPERRVSGAESRAELPRLTLEMVKRGFSDGDIAKVLGGNWLRVFREAWAPEPGRAPLVE